MQSVISLQPGQKIVHSKYTICHTIGTGSSSSVYSISLKKKGRTIMRAAKVEYDKITVPQVNTEISILKSIEGFPNGQYNYLVMELLGPNLEQLMKLSGGKFSLKTVLILGLQMIDRIQVLHEAGFVYKDIKPQNWVIGLENKSHILHLIDFGKCKRYKSKDTGKHMPFKENCRFDGEHIFASINTHNKTEYSRRDDIEAIVYLLIYLRKGKLPWCSSKEFKTKKDRDLMIEEVKKKLPLQQLAYKLPLTFLDLLTYVRTLNYFEKPDYDYIRLLLHRGFSAEEDNLSMIFDWNKIDPLDFAIYSGEPKIVLRPDGQTTYEDADPVEKKEMSTLPANGMSIDVDVIQNKEASKTKKEIVTEGKQNVPHLEASKKEQKGQAVIQTNLI